LRVKQDDVKDCNYIAFWDPVTLHPSLPEDQREIAGREFARLLLVFLVGVGK
jgi:hypothetical protein